jgi:hypothetical protein
LDGQFRVFWLDEQLKIDVFLTSLLHFGGWVMENAMFFTIFAQREELGAKFQSSP